MLSKEKIYISFYDLPLLIELIHFVTLMFCPVVCFVNYVRHNYPVGVTFAFVDRIIRLFLFYNIDILRVCCTVLSY
jgi:hypothetical protein